MIEKAKSLTAKEKTSEFKSQQEGNQLSAKLKNEEHHDHTRAFSSTASWKEGIAEESHLYKKRRTHELAQNDEEAFAQ
jgi:phosphoenolpyruvate carboxylase